MGSHLWVFWTSCAICACRYLKCLMSLVKKNIVRISSLIREDIQWCAQSFQSALCRNFGSSPHILRGNLQGDVYLQAEKRWYKNYTVYPYNLSTSYLSLKNKCFRVALRHRPQQCHNSGKKNKTERKQTNSPRGLRKTRMKITMI